MSKTFKLTLAVAGLAAVIALVAPWSLTDAAIRREVAGFVLQKTGLDGDLDGRMVLALAPQPTLKIEDVSFRDPSGAIVVEAATFKGGLRLLPLFAGRIELASVLLSNANIDIDTQKLTTSQGWPTARDPQGELTLAATKINLRNGQRILASFADVEAAYEWQTSTAAAAVSAKGLWKGERIETGLWLGRFDQFRRGETSPATVRIDTPRGVMSLNGQAELGVGPLLQGKLSVSSPLFSALLDAAGIANPLPMPLRGLNATGSFRLVPQSFALTDARISVDGTAYEGSLSLDWRDERPLLSGTLAASQLQLAPFAARVPAMTSENGWSNEPIGRPGLPALDLDLRLSASRARLDRFQVQDAGIAVKTSEDKLDVSLIDARGYGGRLKGRFSANARESGLAARLTAGFTQVDTASLLNDLFRVNVLTGEATGNLILEGAGDNVAELVETLNGRIEATVQNGDMLGFDMDSALRRTEKRPLSVASEMRRGRTSFVKASLTARIDKGQIELDDSTAAGFSLATQISGGIRLAERALNLRLSSHHTIASGAPKPDGPRLTLDINGAWDDPQVLLDFDSLLRKSEAAAPLFNAPP